MMKIYLNKLFNGADLFAQIDNTPSTEGQMWNLMKIAQAISEKNA